MKKLLLLLPLIMLTGCEYTYRYECQNPDNQGLPQCQPEVCGPSKTCFNDLNAVTPWQDFSEKQIEDMCSANSFGEESFE